MASGINNFLFQYCGFNDRKASDLTQAEYVTHGILSLPVYESVPERIQQLRTKFHILFNLHVSARRLESKED